MNLFTTTAAVIITIVIIMAACGSTILHAAQPCSAPLLPRDVETMVEVMRGDSRGIHLQGVYGLLNPQDHYSNDVNAMTHYMTLPARRPEEGTSDRWFRVSVSPNAYDTKLYLYKKTKSKGDADDSNAQRTLLASSISGGGEVEQQIFYVFRAGEDTPDSAGGDKVVEHELVLGYNLGWKNIQLGCPSLILELAIQPRDSMEKFMQSHCEEDGAHPPKIGKIDPRTGAKAGKYYFKFLSDTASYAKVGHSHHNNNNNGGYHATHNHPFHMIASYDIEVPHLPDRHQKWKFRAAVHSNFIDGGDIGLVLLSGNMTNLNDETPRACDKGKHDCFYGHRALKNTAILQEELVAGNDGRSGFYRLFLVLRRSESVLTERACFPYTVSVDLFPLPSEDTFVNCEADPLIPSLNLPGMYNNHTGILRYHAPVLVNLTMRLQTATLVTTKEQSIFRAWASAHSTVDVDLMLREKSGAATDVGKTVAYSMASYTPDGLVAQLKAGVVYELDVSYATTHKRDTGEEDLDFQQLCDFFELQVHVFPVDKKLNAEERKSDDVSNVDGKAIAQKLRDWFSQHSKDDTVNVFEIGKVSYSQYDHFYKVDTSKRIQQQVITQFQIELPRPAVISMTASADAYSGTPVLEMALADGDPTDRLYGRHRGVGSYLYGEFDTGRYNVTILTPYMQHEWSDKTGTWAQKVPDIPPYIPYDFHLAVGTNEVCVAALPLPNKLEPKSEASHHHLGDLFRLHPGSDGHDIGIVADKDSVLHFLVDESTKPLKVSLVKQSGDQVVAQAQRLQTTHQQHGEVYELFVGIKGGEHYVLRIQAEGTGHSSDNGGGGYASFTSTTMPLCVTFEMELSIAPLPPAAADMPAGSPLKTCEEAAGGEDFHTLTLPASAVETDVWKPNAAKGDYVVKFKLTESAHLRMTMNYDFMEDAPQMKLCPCTATDKEWCQSQCVTSGVFFNGLEIPTTTLLKGEYAIVLGGWRGTFGEELPGDLAPRVINGCHRFRLKLVIAPFREKPAPALCHVRMQHLPRKLNHVGALSSHYGYQMHFMQELKLSSDHQSDASQFELLRKSIVRVQVGTNDFGVGIDLKRGWAKATASGATAHLPTVAYSWNGYGLYAVLEKGKYQLQADYVFENRDGAALQDGGCVSVPIEVAILPVGDMAAKVQTGAAPECQQAGAPAYPPNLISSAGVMRYRSPSTEVATWGSTNSFVGRGFDHKIDFLVGDEIGAFVQADAMFSFEAGGMSMSLTGGELQANGGYAPNRTFPVSRVMNRASTDVYLQRGRYTLRIYDPVPVSAYTKAMQDGGAGAVAGCTRYSLRLSTTDKGSSPAAPPPPERPRITCNGRFDFLPETLRVSHETPPDAPPAPPDAWGQPRPQAAGQWSIVQGSRFEIPFERAVAKTKAMGDVVLNYHVVEIVLKFDVAPGQYVRAWFRSKTSGSPSIRIVDPNGGAEPVLLARGKYYGRNTLSLSYQPTASPYSTNSGTTRQLQLIIKFAYSTLPEYGVDYQDCTGLYRESSYELTFARFPTAHLDSMVTCPSDATRQSKLPPATIAQSGTTHDTYYITSTDIAAYTKATYDINTGGSSADKSWSQNDFLLLPTYRHKTRVTLKTNGMYLMVFVDYNVLISEMRAILLHAGNQSVVVFGDGEPTGAVDERYDAQVFLHASGLLAGEYDVVFEEANAERRIAKEESQYCVPFAAQILVGGGSSSGGSSSGQPNQDRTPHVTFIEAPMPRDNIDVSDGLLLKVRLSEPANVRSLPSGPAKYGVAMLTDQYRGTPVLPYSVYFESPTVLVVLFKSMEWNYGYQLALKPDMILTSSNDYHFALQAATVQPSFRTATCGCNPWGRCADGGACPCQEPAGIRCDKCNDFAFLSSKTHIVGNPQDPAKEERLICERHQGGWHATTEAPDTMPPSPGTKSKGKDDSGKHGNHSMPPGSVWVGPPLRFLRRFLAFGALGFIAIYVIASLWNYRKEIQQHARNPFRVLSSEDEGEFEGGTAIDLEETNAVHAGAGAE